MRLFLVGCALFAALIPCARADEGDEDVLHGSINYPFIGPGHPIAGTGKKDEKLVVRSAVGNTEYQLEVPSAVDDMDIEIPIVPLAGSSVTGTGIGGRQPGMSNPSSADRELLGSLPHIDDKYPSETGVLDKAFGTGPGGGYRQSPSYVMGIAKVNEHYRRREYEYAMVELNNLLAFYPNSPKLHKMKGTVLVRTGNLELAERAWNRALQLEPDDAGLAHGLRQLQGRIAASKKVYANNSPGPAYSTAAPATGAAQTQSPAATTSPGPKVAGAQPAPKTAQLSPSLTRPQSTSRGTAQPQVPTKAAPANQRRKLGSPFR